MSSSPPRAADWTAQDTTWALGLFSTAIGAGILFLPIELGQAGMVGFLLVALLIAPSTYFAHLALARFVLSHPTSEGNIVDVCRAHWGKRAAQAVSWLYIAAIVPNLLVYSIGLTNTVESFVIHQLGAEHIDRFWLSLALCSLMMLVCSQAPARIIRACQLMAYPLIAALLLMSFYLMPFWRLDMLHFRPEPLTLLSNMWLSLPVLIFAFNYSSAVSSFSYLLHQEHGPSAPGKAQQILLRTSALLMGLVLLFTLSSLMILSPEDLGLAKTQNLSVLSYIANISSAPVIVLFGPPIACLAIFSSFCGFYLGAREGLLGVLEHTTSLRLPKRSHWLLIQLFLFFANWLAAYVNPNILSLMEAVCGPLIACILFLLPIFALWRLPALARWRSVAMSLYLVGVGLLSMTAIWHPFFD